MTGNTCVALINQDWVCESERSDAVGYLADLTIGMHARVDQPPERYGPAIYDVAAGSRADHINLSAYTIR